MQIDDFYRHGKGTVTSLLAPPLLQIIVHDDTSPLLPVFLVTVNTNDAFFGIDSMMLEMEISSMIYASAFDAGKISRDRPGGHHETKPAYTSL